MILYLSKIRSLLALTEPIQNAMRDMDFSGSNRGLFCTRLEGEMTLAVAELLTELTSEVTTPLFLFNVTKSLVVFFCTDAALASKKVGLFRIDNQISNSFWNTP